MLKIPEQYSFTHCRSSEFITNYFISKKTNPLFLYLSCQKYRSTGTLYYIGVLYHNVCELINRSSVGILVIVVRHLHYTPVKEFFIAHSENFSFSLKRVHLIQEDILIE